jgi:hypothetical protein
MEKKLKVKTINFEEPLTFNEWVVKYNVSRYYIEPTKYFQGNPGSPRVTMDTKMEFMSPTKSSADRKSNLIGKLMSLISF